MHDEQRADQSGDEDGGLHDKSPPAAQHNARRDKDVARDWSRAVLAVENIPVPSPA